MHLLRSKICALILVSIAFVVPTANSQEPNLETLEQKFSYALGIQFATQILSQLEGAQLPVERDSLVLGLMDTFRGDLRLTEEEIAAAITAVQQQVAEQETAMMEETAMQGDEFRANYANQDGITATSSGILYKVMTEGDGASPTLQNSVTVHYRGTLIDGTEFDSSYSRNQPTTFPLTSIILGWREVLQLMQVGAKWEVVIPPQLAYGQNGAPPAIPPNATLVFEIELLEIQ